MCTTFGNTEKLKIHLFALVNLFYSPASYQKRFCASTAAVYRPLCLVHTTTLAHGTRAACQPYNMYSPVYSGHAATSHHYSSTHQDTGVL